MTHACWFGLCALPAVESLAATATTASAVLCGVGEKLDSKRAQCSVFCSIRKIRHFPAHPILPPVQIKAYAAATSTSLAVIASTVDSVLDLMSGGFREG